MMTRKWMSNDEDFTKLHSRIESLAEHCSLMRPAPAQVRRSRRKREGGRRRKKRRKKKGRGRGGDFD